MTDAPDDRNAQFEAWLEKVCNRSKPLHDKITRARIFARELTEGFIEGFWSRTILAEWGSYCIRHKGTVVVHSGIGLFNLRVEDAASLVNDNRYEIQEPNTDFGRAARYLLRRWNYDWPAIELLKMLGFIVSDKAYQLDDSTLALLSESIPANIFISYHRKSSSALGLLIVARMKASGMEPFIDMALVPGEAWHAGLQERIKSYDALILLLAPETLTSEYVLREIEWALEAGVEVIPLWHSGFSYESDKWSGIIPDAMEGYLAKTHAIRVLEESASGYNTAIVELLNRFGVTPD